MLTRSPPQISVAFSLALATASCTFEEHNYYISAAGGSGSTGGSGPIDGIRGTGGAGVGGAEVGAGGSGSGGSGGSGGVGGTRGTGGVGGTGGTGGVGGTGGTGGVGGTGGMGGATSCSPDTTTGMTAGWSVTEGDPLDHTSAVAINASNDVSFVMNGYEVVRIGAYDASGQLSWFYDTLQNPLGPSLYWATARVYHAGRDDLGNSYFAGRTSDPSTLPFAPTIAADTTFIVSYDANGSYRWLITLPGATQATGSINGPTLEYDAQSRMTVTGNGDVHLAGPFSGPADIDGDTVAESGTWYWVRVDSTGAIVASHTSNDGPVNVRGIGVDGSGDVAVFHDRAADIHIARLSNVGAPLNTITLPMNNGSPLMRKLGAGAVDASGHLYFAGAMDGSQPWNFGAGPIDVSCYPFQGTDTGYLASVTSTGAVRWQTSLGGLVEPLVEVGWLTTTAGKLHVYDHERDSSTRLNHLYRFDFDGNVEAIEEQFVWASDPAQALKTSLAASPTGRVVVGEAEVSLMNQLPKIFIFDP